MKIRYEYVFNVEVSAPDNPALLLTGTMPYPGGGDRLDTVSIGTHRITLTCQRSSLIDLDGIFTNHNSGLYGQLSKTIAFYVCMVGAIPEITRISVEVMRLNNRIASKHLIDKDLRNRVSMDQKFATEFCKEPLMRIFSETGKGPAILKAVSHLIRAKTKTDIFDRFESLWKAYNVLYKAITGKKTDHECHVALRKLLIDHPEASSSAAGFIHSLTAEQIRSQLRWRALVLNDFETRKKAQAFSDFVLRYRDARIMKVMNEILPYRQQFLDDEGLLALTTAHIGAQILANQEFDEELVALLCIKYMYFVRNKSVHGERFDRIIGVGNKETTEVKWLSKILERLIIDLINASDLYD